MIRKEVEKLRGLVFTPEELEDVILPIVAASKGSPDEEKSALEVLDGMKYSPNYDLGLYDTIINMGYKLKEHKNEIDKAFKSDKSYYIAFGRSVHLDDIIMAAKEAFLCAGYNPARYNFEQCLYEGAYFVDVKRK